MTCVFVKQNAVLQIGFFAFVVQENSNTNALSIFIREQKLKQFGIWYALLEDSVYVTL